MHSVSKSRVFTAPPRIPDRVVTTNDPPATPEVGVPNAVPNLGALSSMASLLGDLIRVTAPPPAPVKLSAKPVETRSVKPIQVGGGVQSAKLIRKVIPGYPQLAKQARISGVVRLVGVIGKDGTIQNLQLVSGHPLLSQAALEAVRQWVYDPTLLNGHPSKSSRPSTSSSP